MTPISTSDCLGLWCLMKKLSPALLGEIRYSTVTPCDCDGLVVGINLDHQEPLENAACTRFYSVDAQELSPVH